jgi:mRNA interferase YafQ
MREIKYTTRFQRDYKREKSGRHGTRLDALLMGVVTLLVVDTPLPRRKPDDESLELVRLGSHGELGL